MSPEAKLRGSFRSKGKKTLLRPVIKCFVILLKSRLAKNHEEIICSMQAGSQICFGLKEHDPITCKSKVQVVASLGS